MREARTTGNAKLPRRLQAAPTDTYGMLQRGALRQAGLSQEECGRLERERPGLVVIDGDAVLAGWPASGAIDLQYAFPSHVAFARKLPSMLERVLASVDRHEAPIGICLRLTERSSRPYVEPVLAANGFELVREWWRMTLAELPEGVVRRDELGAGFLLRPARPEDADAIAELDAVSFTVPSLTPGVAREQIERARLFRVLEDVDGGRVIGYLQLGAAEGVGYVSELVVSPGYRRLGLGEALLRWALAWFGSQGLSGAALTVNTDNAPAIALYRKLGFVAGEVGLDYRRPIDEEEVRQVLEKQRAVHIQVRRRQ